MIRFHRAVGDSSLKQFDVVVERFLSGLKEFCEKLYVESCSHLLTLMKTSKLANNVNPFLSHPLSVSGM